MSVRSSIAFATAVTAFSLVAHADVALPSIFSDHAVLQRGHAIPVYGTAAPGEAVTVELAGAKGNATADSDGKWRVELPSRAEGGPFALVVSGTNKIELSDVYVGEVWLASGQSNMEFTVSAKAKSFAGTMNEDAEIADANHPLIRMYTVPLATSDVPLGIDAVKADWKVCSPATVPAFSAAGYFFARDLEASLHVPIGIVVSAYGASNAQTWIKRNAIAAEPTIAPLLAKYDKARADFASGAATTQAAAALEKWQAAADAAKAAGRPAPRRPGPPRDPAKDQHSPSTCYNAMIAPIEPYAVRGAIWYQGESNGIDNELYLSLMTTLIDSWRQARGEAFPFIAVQLAGYRAPATQPTADSQIANVREAQRLTMRLPNSTMATAFDIGDVANVHPKDKQAVGRRLALAARATVYGEPVEWSGPNVESAAREGDAIVVRFTHAKGLATKDKGAPQSFAIRGADGTWSWADATIDGETIRLKLAPDAQPTEVRYAWADNPASANLVNGDGLPALPFRAEVMTKPR